ncbi:hypothetical protein [Acinetobacter bereziniae]|nr:hypothetical protein [Acinetobacter bereziniae]
MNIESLIACLTAHCHGTQTKDHQATQPILIDQQVSPSSHKARV